MSSWPSWEDVALVMSQLEATYPVRVSVSLVSGATGDAAFVASVRAEPSDAYRKTMRSSWLDGAAQVGVERVIPRSASGKTGSVLYRMLWELELQIEDRLSPLGLWTVLTK